MIGPRLYAILLDHPRGERRRLSYRGQEHEDLVPFRIQALAGGTPVLLDGAPGCWETGVRVDLTPWAPQPTVEAMREGTLRSERIRARSLEGGGVWSSDADGRACELAEYDSPDHGSVGVVSYSGWRLSDLVDREVEAIVTKVGNIVYYVVPARAVPAELGARRSQVFAAVAPPAPRSSPVEWTVQLDEVEFCDGFLRVPSHEGRRIVIDEKRSRCEYDAVKDALKRHFPEWIHVCGLHHDDRRGAFRIRNLDVLDRIFKKARPASYIHEIVRDGGWHRAGEIVRGLAEQDGESAAPADILSVPELGFDRRKEAFARLFRLRDEQREIWVQPNRAMLIPVTATDGGPDFWIWELVGEGNATYLFRPRDRVMGKHLFDWLADLGMRRQDLLESKDLQGKIGFVRRVIHRDAGEPLDSWWARICEALDRPGTGGDT